MSVPPPTASVTVSLGRIDHEDVVARPADEAVKPDSRRSAFVAVAADERVIAVAAIEDVIIVSAVNGILAGVAGNVSLPPSPKSWSSTPSR